jgi:hypothetical protein
MFMLKYIDFYSRNMDLIFGQVISSILFLISYVIVHDLQQDWMHLKF